MKNIVIIPTYNEKETIEAVVRSVFQNQSDIDILIVDDDSPDGTQKVVERLMKDYPRLSIMRRKGKEGLGKAYISAFIEVLKNPEIETVITMDADFSHNPKYIPTLLEKRRTHDFVIGSRYISGGGTRGWKLWRRILSFGGNFYTKFVTRMPIHDITAGFGAISANSLREIELRNVDSSGYAFLIELKYALYKSGSLIAEIPIIFTERIGGESKISNHIIGEGILAPWRLLLQKRKIYTNCIICENEQRHTKYAKKNKHTVFRCEQCKILKVDPLPSNIAQIYSEDYFNGAFKGFGYVDYDKDKEAMKNIFIKYIDIIEGFVKKNAGKPKLLDIGAATGYFMEIAQKRNFLPIGIEISEAAMKAGRNKGLNIHHGTIENYDSKDEKFDVITILDVLEHVTDPIFLIRKSKSMLSKNGVLVINTPDSGSLYARMLGSKWHLILPPEHIYYLNINAVKKILTREGFDVVLSTKIGKKFTIDYIVTMISKWIGFRPLSKLASVIERIPVINKIYIPINFRDNMFVVARVK